VRRYEGGDEGRGDAAGGLLSFTVSLPTARPAKDAMVMNVDGESGVASGDHQTFSRHTLFFTTLHGSGTLSLRNIAILYTRRKDNIKHRGLGGTLQRARLRHILYRGYVISGTPLTKSGGKDGKGKEGRIIGLGAARLGPRFGLLSSHL